jgi:hypothetical protein
MLPDFPFAAVNKDVLVVVLLCISIPFSIFVLCVLFKDERDKFKRKELNELKEKLNSLEWKVKE